MALDQESVLSTPSNYASPQQLEMGRQLAMALMRPQQGQGEFMQSRLQPAARIVNALLGAKMMQQAGMQERTNAAGIVGSGSPLSQPGMGQPAPTGDIGNGLTRITTNSGVPYTVSAQYADRFKGLFDDLEAAGYRINPDPDAGGYNVRNIAGTNTPSQHSYGLAVDINPSRNQPGTPGDIPPDLARALAQKHGLTWGGDFKHATPDPMHFEVSRNAPTAQAQGPVQSDASGSPANAQTQPPVSTPGQTPQATPATPGSPQMSPGGQPPPQLFRQPLITREQVYSALISQSPMAPKLMEMYLQQQQPQEMKYGDSTYRYIPAHPEIPPTLIPQPHQFKEGEAGGVKYPYQIQQGPQGFSQSPVPSAGAPQALPAGPGGPAPSVGTGAQPPSDFGSATQAVIDLKQKEAEAQTQGQERGKIFGSQFRGTTGVGQIAAQQKQNLATVINIANDKDFVAGPGADPARFFQRVATQLSGLAGATPEEAAAAPREVFDMVMKRILADQFSGIKSMSAETGEQGGRIFRSMLDIEEKALPTSNDSLPGIRAKLAILDRAGDLQIKWAKDAYDYAASHGGRLDETFGKTMLEEMANARLIPAGGRIRDLSGTTQTQQQGDSAGRFSRPLSPEGWSGFRRVD